MVLHKIPLAAAQMGSDEMVELTISVDKTFVPALVDGADSKDAASWESGSFTCSFNQASRADLHETTFGSRAGVARSDVDGLARASPPRRLTQSSCFSRTVEACL